jgi:A/G-specific adenine glycosylase
LTRLFDFRKPIDSAHSSETLWQNAALLVPKTDALLYNSALIDLGALICVSRQPKCGICPVKEFCSAKDPQTLPVRKSRARIKRLTEKHAFVVRQDKILLEQSAARWRGMWILPPLQTVPANHQPIYESVFPFTNHRVALNVFVRRQQKTGGRLQRWIGINSLESIPIPSPHRRALQSLLKRDRRNYMRLER